MNINVRLGGGLAQLIGHPRLTVALPENSTITDLLTHLRAEYPALAQKLDTAVPMISGRHAAPTQILTTGHEVALLLPVAGGCR